MFGNEPSQCKDDAKFSCTHVTQIYNSRFCCTHVTQIYNSRFRLHVMNSSFFSSASLESLTGEMR